MSVSAPCSADSAGCEGLRRSGPGGGLRLADGRLRCRVRSSAQWEIIPWVQSYGAFAELDGPASWRETLRASLEAVGGARGHAGE